MNIKFLWKFINFTILISFVWGELTGDCKKFNDFLRSKNIKYDDLVKECTMENDKLIKL